MSYEYFSPLDRSLNLPLHDLVELSGLNNLATVISTKEDEILLRWIDTPVRSDWPEDVTIVRDDQGVFAIFHTGTRSKFLLALAELSKEIERVTGRPTEFLET